MRQAAAISRISFEQPEDWERATARRKSFGEGALSRHGSGLSQTSEEADEWELWREDHPCALQQFEQLVREANGKLVAVFLDYDGTLTPIVSNPDAAFMPEQTRDAVRRVAELFPTAIVSGRGREKVEAFVQLRQLFYAGSHGMDIVGPRQSGSGAGSSAAISRSQSGDCVVASAGAPAAAPINAAIGAFAAASTPAPAAAAPAAAPAAEADAGEEQEEGRFTFQPAAQFEPLMNSVFAQLEAAVAPFAGSSVEHNKFCVSVHFRNCAPEDYPAVVAATERVAGVHAQLHITRGRKVLEVRPQVDWDKGAALAHLLEAMGLDDPQRVYALYIGDDRTDEDAFRVLLDRGLGSGILVSTRVKPTAGRWTLRDPTEVAAFLNRLVAWGRSDANHWHSVGRCVGWRIAPSRRNSLPASAPGSSCRTASPAQQQQQLLAATFAAMDGLALQQQPQRAGSDASSPAGLPSAASLDRPPLPPKSRRAFSPSQVDLLGRLSEEQQQQQQQANGNGSALSAAAGSC